MGGVRLMPRVTPAALSALAWIALAAVPASAQVNVLTQHNDVARTGANLSETILTTANVNVSGFGKLFERTVDDQIYGQPLYVAGVNIPTIGTRNVIYVATVNDSLYAFDADDPAASSPLWSVSYINMIKLMIINKYVIYIVVHSWAEHRPAAEPIPG